MVTKTVLRGATRLFPFIILLALLVFSMAALASGPGPAEPSATSMWPIWGAAALQVAVTLVGGLLLWQIQRSTSLQDQRLVALEKRLDKTDEIVVNLRTESMKRSEVKEEVGEAKAVAGTMRSELREDIKNLASEVSQVRADNVHLNEKLDRLLTIMGANRV